MLTEKPKYCVAMSSSWCASSTTAWLQAGITSPYALCRTAASAHSRWWLTITMSDAAARWRMRVTKQSSYRGHSVPRQVSAVADDLAPERQVLGQILELGAIAGLGAADHSRMIGRKTSCAHRAVRRAVVAELIEAMQAQVVRAPLHAGGGERHAERVAQRRNVLEEDLFLQVLGAGGDRARAAG